MGGVSGNMLTVATVLKSGGIYKPEHVYRLKHMVERYTACQFVCLSDLPLHDCPRISLAYNWPGWWSKIELFRPGLWFGPVVYLDLDTDVIGDISTLQRDSFTMLSDFYRPQNPASGVMAWTGDLPVSVFDSFRLNPSAAMRRYSIVTRWGDQGYIRDHAGEIARFNGPSSSPEIVSYKVHCQNGVPDGASVIAYHGNPKPWDLVR